MYWDRFDICEAYYMYAVNYHQGQFSREYEIFGRLIMINFRPPISISSGDASDLTANARAIYDNLVQNGLPGKSCLDRIIDNHHAG